MKMPAASQITTFLFTDIEGSSRLWEEMPERMRPALARHDAIVREAVRANGGSIVKSTGDGIHAAFTDPLQAIAASVALLNTLSDPQATDGLALRLRCGMHAGAIEQRDGDYFGSAVNRAARIMGIAHGGQALMSRVVAELVRDQLTAEVSLRDLGAVQLRDLSGSEHVFQIVHPQLRSDFPALRSLEATPNNLPQQLTSFIGREHEIAEVRKLLGQARLVTLLGMGGLGKTRMSMQIAGEVIDHFPDGVWLVELAPVADPDLVPQALASVLGVKEDSGGSLLDALLGYLADKQVLLILDNCEHLVGACAKLAHDLLQAGPDIAVVATSRERLNVAGEHTYAVPTLPVPGNNDVAVEPLLRFGAVNLFVDRARAAQPSFKLSEANSAAIASICRTLDGIPLAIELAVARVRAMSVQEVAARLSDRFRLLTSGNRSMLPHHQTLRASIDWSHELLSPEERILLRQISIFAGGWTLAAAEAVGSDGVAGAHMVIDRLAHLVDKSLVIFDEPTNRYRLLETVREYAREKLQDSGELETTRSRHLAFFLSLLEQAYAQLRGPEQGEWFAQLDSERENLLAAHRACDHVEHGADFGLDLAFRTKPYWIRQGLLGQGYRVTHDAVGRAGQPSREKLGRGLAVLGELCAFMGRYSEALLHLEASLGIARELGDKEMAVNTLNTLCMASVGSADFARAHDYATEGLAVARELGKKRKIAAMLVSLAQLNRSEGALDAAEPQYAEGLALTRELGDRESVAVVLLNLAMVAIRRESLVQARDALREALAIVVETGSNRLGQSVLDVAAGLAVTQGEMARAARLFGAVEAEMKATELQRDHADDAFIKPLIELAKEAIGVDAFTSSLEAGNAAGYQAAIEETSSWLDSPP